MKFSEMTNEQAMDAVANLIDPFCDICSKELLGMIAEKDFRGAAKKLLKEHKGAVITILATLDGEDPAAYRFNPFTLVSKLVGVLNDPDVVQFFMSQLQTAGLESSGAASATIEL